MGTALFVLVVMVSFVIVLKIGWIVWDNIISYYFR